MISAAQLQAKEGRVTKSVMFLADKLQYYSFALQ